MNDYVEHTATYKREVRKISRRNVYSKVLGRTKRGTLHNNDPFKAEREPFDFSKFSSDLFRSFLNDLKEEWKEAKFDEDTESKLISVLNKIKPKRFDKIIPEFFTSD